MKEIFPVSILYHLCFYYFTQNDPGTHPQSAMIINAIPEDTKCEDRCNRVPGFDLSLPGPKTLRLSLAIIEVDVGDCPIRY